jgi:outer membrane protein assembly factor BamB
MNYILLFLTASLIFSSADNQNISQWRGPNRDGIYTEKGLLKIWPENGPQLVWSFEGLGTGHGNTGFSRDKVFVLGMIDSIGFLYAFDYKGKLLWKKEYGKEWYESYTGSRSTPTVVEDLVYFESGQGIVYCFNANSGKKIWSVDLLQRFNAKNITWGMAESILIDGDHLFCTPGGKENNIVALNRFTGATIWTSPGSRQPAAYCSPILFRHNNTGLIVTITAASIICVDAKTGQFYWQVPQFQGNKIHANSPVYYNGRIYCSSQTGEENSGLVAIKLSDDGKSAKVEWRNDEYSNLISGFVIKDGYIYGSKYEKRVWNCIDASNGKILYNSNKLGDGVIIWADGLFYCYSDRGDLALVDATPSYFNIISRFRITMGTDQHWSHPVIHMGRLYLRHGNALMVYDIKSK